MLTLLTPELEGRKNPGEFNINRAWRITSFHVPCANDLNINASMKIDSAGKYMYIVHEACEMWGYDEQLGRHRELYAWQFDLEKQKFKPCENTCSGKIPIPLLGLKARFHTNATPINPYIAMDINQPLVFYRYYRQRGFKSFGWDTYVVRLTEKKHKNQIRISEHCGYPETSYAAIIKNGKNLLFNPCCDQIPCAGYSNGKWKKLTDHPGRPYNSRLEIQNWDFHLPLPDISVIKGLEGRYSISPAVYDIALPPPPVEAPSAPKYLLWADLHVHTTYSKCMGAVDGNVHENMFYQKEILGCDVLCLTEHTHLMNDTEFSYTCDVLEMTAKGKNVPLYGTESLITGQDTIYYTRERNTFERLRVIAQIYRTRAKLYDAIKNHFPIGDILVARHFDGPGREGDDFSPDSFDDNIEMLMEAMQNRGNSFIGKLMGNDAMAIGKAAIWVECNGAFVGEETNAQGEVRIKTWISSALGIRKVALFRNGQFLEWVEVDCVKVFLELIDRPQQSGAYWYSVTAEAKSSFLFQPIICHTSPIFVNFTV